MSAEGTLSGHKVRAVLCGPFHFHDWQVPLAFVRTDFKNGGLLLLTDRNGNSLHFTGDDITSDSGTGVQFIYDDAGRISQIIDPASNSVRYTYDAAGNLVAYTNRNGNVINDTYDANHYVTSETWYNSVADANATQNPTNTINYTYDSTGRILSESDNNSSDTYQYDAQGDLISTTESSVDGPTVTLAYQYNAADQRSQMAATIDGTADFVDDYSYDSSGRVASVTQHGVPGGDAVADVEVDFTYNDANQVLTIDRYQDGQLAVEGNYFYNSSGELVGLVYHQGNTILDSYTWTYSGEGSGVSEQSSTDWLPTGGKIIANSKDVVSALESGGLSGLDLISSCTSTDGTVNYSYDPTGQLTGATYTGGQASESYTYDANGNRITTNGSTYTTGADNQLLSDGTYTYAYDAEGNRIAKFIDTNHDGVLDAGDTNITQYTWERAG